MRVRWYVVAGIAFLVALTFDALALGAASRAHPAIANQIASEAPLAQTYVVIGTFLIEHVPGARGAGDALADAAFHAAWPLVEEQPDTAFVVLYREARGGAAWFAGVAYWGAPLLLLAFLPLYFLRERGVHLIGGPR